MSTTHQANTKNLKEKHGKKTSDLTAGAENNQNLLHAGRPICVAGGRNCRFKWKKTMTTTTSAHAAPEQSKQRVADQQKIVLFSPILALHLIVPAISGNVSAWSTTFQLIKRCVGPFQPCRPSAPLWWETRRQRSICVAILLSARSF